MREEKDKVQAKAFNADGNCSASQASPICTLCIYVAREHGELAHPMGFTCRLQEDCTLHA